ncbi:hypothetical protein WN55_11593 [Dufourea novaeangliae]|uniref:Uncharacterized protein n=1 Tax=Dufourea novaeangliae TaxID=178035 RepID=A0A154PB40_DUFNO|nr:hypothetical protein WN55_11593 [Dufourea novaeangliae]
MQGGQNIPAKKLQTVDVCGGRKFICNPKNHENLVPFAKLVSQLAEPSESILQRPIPRPSEDILGGNSVSRGKPKALRAKLRAELRLQECSKERKERQTFGVSLLRVESIGRSRHPDVALDSHRDPRSTSVTGNRTTDNSRPAGVNGDENDVETKEEVEEVEDTKEERKKARPSSREQFGNSILPSCFVGHRRCPTVRQDKSAGDRVPKIKKTRGTPPWKTEKEQAEVPIAGYAEGKTERVQVS